MCDLVVTPAADRRRIARSSREGVRRALPFGMGLGLGFMRGPAGSAAPTPLNPASDSTVQNWWRADLGVTTASGKVTAVADQRGTAGLSAYSGDATGTALTANDANFNGKASVHVAFNLDQLYTPSAYTVASAGFAILMVATITTTQYFFRSGGGTAQVYIHNQGTGGSTRVSTGSGAIISSYANSANNWMGTSSTIPIAMLLNYGGTHATHQVYRNSGATYGTLVSFAGAQTSGDPGNASAVNQLLFDTDGAWAESIVFNVALSAAQIQSAFAYVYNRYGI